MKNFIRTVAGKSILFIACILSLCILTASVFGAALMIGFDFYTDTEQEIYDELIRHKLRSDGYEIVWNYTNSTDEINYNDTNLIFELLDEEGNVLMRSEDTTGVKTDSQTYSYSYRVLINNGITDFFSHYDEETADENVSCYTINYRFKSGFPENDSYALLYHLIHTAYRLRYAVYAIGIIALMAVISCFITLMCVSARKPNTQELCPGPLNRIPFDLLSAAVIALGIFLIYLGDSLFYEDYAVIASIIAMCLLYANIVLGLCMSIAARIKQKTFLKNTVIFYCLRLIWEVLRQLGRFTLFLFRSIPLIWRTVLIVSVISFLELIVIVCTWWESDVLFIFWLIEKALLVPAILYLAIILRRLEKAGDSLAKGNLDYQTKTQGMFWDFKRHGENLNSIAKGMSIAVEDRLKSERMKTELITNVSHDIKTPLTSIINYATLIDNEPCDNARITEYASVLVRQSERLKRLIEDLVEASKASAGNLEVNLTACDAAVFLTQAGGEYAEKLESAGLTLITKQPDNPVKIMADGRRMWRIFDNLMNNICKYALRGTRVYLSLETVDNNAVIIFKNTSRDSLDITEDELMERFVRGDTSRNTEGNGLGLSIAKSLAELQNGSLRLDIDGDLFKAILTFPVL